MEMSKSMEGKSLNLRMKYSKETKLKILDTNKFIAIVCKKKFSASNKNFELACELF